MPPQQWGGPLRGRRSSESAASQQNAGASRASSDSYIQYEKRATDQTVGHACDFTCNSDLLYYSTTVDHRKTGWKPPARAPASQPRALYQWPRVACMHSGPARTFLPYVSHRKALLISPRSTVLQLQVGRFSYCISPPPAAAGRGACGVHAATNSRILQ